MDNTLIWLIIGILAVILIGGMIIEKDEGIKGWKIDGTSCEDDYDCHEYFIDCITHIDDTGVYSWSGDVVCDRNHCVCMSF